MSVDFRPAIRRALNRPCNYAFLPVAKSGGRGPTRFPGIDKAANAFGVDRVSLWRALTHRWDLPRLEARYYRWLKSRKPKAKKPSVKKLEAITK